MLIDVQFSSGHNDYPRLRDAVLQAEAEGFDTTWVLDHFDGAMVGGDRAILECFTLLGALARPPPSAGSWWPTSATATRPCSPVRADGAAHRGDRFSLGLGGGARHRGAAAWAHITIPPVLADRHALVVHNIDVVRDHTRRAHRRRREQRRAGDGGRPPRRQRQRAPEESAAKYLAAARGGRGDRPFECSGWAPHDDPAHSRRPTTWASTG
jgi:hypothetical protein